MRMRNYKCDTYFGKRGSVTFLVLTRGILSWFKPVRFSFCLYDAIDKADKQVVKFIVSQICGTVEVKEESENFIDIRGWASFYRAREAYEVIKLELDNPTFSKR